MQYLKGLFAVVLTLTMLSSVVHGANTITTPIPTLDPYEEDKVLMGLAENESYTGPYVVPSPTQTAGIEISYSDAVISYEPENNVTVAYDGTTNGTHVIEVHQGDTVYTGDVCDLRLVEGWYGKLVHHDNGRVVDISSFTRKILISESVFIPGRWDQWSDFDFDEDNGNTEAFKVKKGPRPEREQINYTEEAPAALRPYLQPVPVKHVSDYVVARGDPISIDVPNNSKAWMFGSKDGYYGLPDVNGTILIPGNATLNMYPGTYILAIDSPGNQSAGVNIRYDKANDTIEYFNPSEFRIVSIDLFGLDPRTRYDRFKSIGGKAADIYTEKEIVIEDPYVEIVSSDQIYNVNKTAAQIVTGYTNAAIGANITLVIDKDKHSAKDLKYSTFSGIVKGNPRNPGDMRWFELVVPLLLDNYAAGEHEISVSTAGGGYANVDFFIYESPEHSFIPNNTIKYVNGSEWRPDPTPKIVEVVVTQTVIKTVTIPVTPSNEQVYAQQKKAEDAKWSEAVGTVITWAVVMFVLLCGIMILMYGITVYRRL